MLAPEIVDTEIPQPYPGTLRLGSSYSGYIDEQATGRPESVADGRLSWLENPSIIARQHVHRDLGAEAYADITENQVRAWYGDAGINLLRNGIDMPIRVLTDEDMKNGRMHTEIALHVFDRHTARPRGVLQISGGAKGLSLPSITTSNFTELDQIESFMKAEEVNMYSLAHVLYQIASHHELAVLDGGTNSGIMAAYASIHSKHKINNILNQKKLRQIIESSDQHRASLLSDRLLVPPLLVQAVPGACVLVPGYEDPVSYEYGRYGISPADITFIMKAKKFGGERWGFTGASGVLGYVGAMELVMRSMLDEISYDNPSQQRIVITINGGLLTLDEVRGVMTADLNSTTYDGTSGSSVVLLKGTQRGADHMVAMLEDDRLTADKLFNSLPAEDNDLKNPNYRETLDVTAAMLKEHASRELVHVVDVKDAKFPPSKSLTGTVQHIINTQFYAY